MSPNIRRHLRTPTPARGNRQVAAALAILWAATSIAWLLTRGSAPNTTQPNPIPPVAKPEQGRGPLHTFHVTANGRLLRKFPTLEQAAAHRRQISSAHRITTLTCSCGEQAGANDHRRIRINQRPEPNQLSQKYEPPSNPKTIPSLCSRGRSCHRPFQRN